MTVKTTRRFFLFNLILCWVFLSFKSGFAGDYNCQEGTCTAINYNLEDSTFGGEESNNKLILSEGSTANNITITTNGEAVIEDTTTATEFLVTMTGTSGNPGSVTIETGGKGEKFTIENGGKVIVDGGSLVGDNKIAKGGSILVKKDGTASNITAVDGFIEIQDGAVVNNVTLTGNGELDINIGHRNSGYESSTPTLNTVKVQEGSTLKLYNSGSGGDVDNVVIEGKLVSNIENGGNYTSFNASNVEIKKTGSFELSTNDTIDSLVVEDDTARSPGVIAAKKASDILVKNDSSFVVKADGEASRTEVKGNGSLIVDGKATNVVLNENAKLTTSAGSEIKNLTALGSSQVNIADGTLSGTLTIGKNASGFDLNTLFAEGSKLDSLTFTDGQNKNIGDSFFNQDTSGGQTLHLQDGEYSANISGWTGLELTNSDLYAKTTLNVENMIIYNNSNLFIENPLSVTSLGGSLENSGTIAFLNKGSVGNTLTVGGDFNGATGSSLQMRIDFVTKTADKIIIEGTASGHTDVYLYPIADKPSRDRILFAEANNVSGGADVFDVKRVAGSYYEWDTIFDSNKWYAQLKSAINNGKQIIVPEAVAYYGLIDNTFMQTSSLGANLRNNIAISEYAKVPCKNVRRRDLSVCRGNRPVFSAWIAPISSSVTVESPFVYDAVINGFDGGLDLLSNGNTKIGLLASYRRGSYNYEENGDEYEFTGEAETNMTSYIAGAYIRHDSKRWSSVLAGYAGMLDADIETSDNINTSTSGTTYGVTLDVNYIYENINGIRIEPGVRVSYTTVEMDPVDNFGGKTQEFDNASRTEVEVGIRFAKRWELPNSRAELFIRPSIVQILDDTEDFALDDNYKLTSAEDKTLVRVSGGLSFDMTNNLSAALTGSYSFGDEISETSGNLSVMYKF